MKKKDILFFSLLAVVFVLILVILVVIYFVIQNQGGEVPYNGVSEDGTFSTSFIRASHEEAKGKNYMISPYSVEVALSMLREGTLENSYDEINKVAPERSIKTLAVSKKVNIANAVFIRDIYKNDVRSDFTTKLKENYNAEVIYDPFVTPDKINDWVNKETNGMIPSILNEMDPDFILGLANAVAMEEDWLIPFKCDNTKKEKFSPISGKDYHVAMMSQNYDSVVGYYTDDEADIVTIPYKSYDRTTGEEAEGEGEQLEFIGILPKDIDSYITSLDLDKVKKIDSLKKIASEDELEVYVELPRFEFSYDFEQFKKTLINMGIVEIFSSDANLNGMLDNQDDAYVDQAIHKTYVKVDEKGTKAAAVTYFGVEKNAAIVGEKEYVSVIFNKPFIFMIKDTASNEILFFGVVYEPNKWDASKKC